jgi:WD40 repeat protein
MGRRPCLTFAAYQASQTGAARRTLEGHASSVNGVAVTPDGKRAVSASGDHTLKVWDLESGAALCTLQGHSDVVSGVAVTPDGKRAASASEDQTLKMWDLETGAALATFRCDARPNCCTFASRQKMIAGDAGGRLQFLLLEEGTPGETGPLNA